MGGGGGSMGDIFCMPLLLQLPSVSDPAVLCSLYSASRRKDAGGKHSPNFSGACRLVRRCVLCVLSLPQIMEVTFLACNLLTLDKVPIGFHARNSRTQPCFPHS